MEEQLFNPMFGHNTTPLDQATIAHLMTTPSPNRFVGFVDLDEDSAPADDINNGLGPLAEIPPNDATVRKDGGSQPLIDEDDNAFPVATPPMGVTMIVTALAKHDRIMTLAIAAVVLPPPPDGAVPPSNVTTSDISTTTPMLADMMLFLQHSNEMMQQNHRTIITHLSAINGPMDTANEDTRLICATLASKADSTEIARLDSRMEAMTPTVALTVREELTATLGLQLAKLLNSIVDVKANVQHLTKKLMASVTQLAALEERTPTSTTEGPVSEPGITDNDARPNAEIIVLDVTGDVGCTNPPSSTPARAAQDLLLPPTRRSRDPTGLLGTTFGYGHMATDNNPLDSDGTYTLPPGHLGSCLGGPTTPICAEFCPARHNEQAANAWVAHLTGPAGRHHHPAISPPTNPYTPSQPPPKPPQITPPPINTAYDAESRNCPSSPCLGGPVLLLRAHQDCTKTFNLFDIQSLAHPQYHRKDNGVPTLTAGFLANCGYNMLPLDNVVGSLNKITSAHRRIWDTWYNPTANTYGPQIDCILLKSFKLFPTIKSLATEDVVNFYDCFQDLSTPHLLAIMPLDSIVLKN
jgi:hypothetical protein